MENKLSKIILKKIEKENIKPIPKWIFMLKFIFKVIAIIILSLISSIWIGIFLWYIFNIDIVLFERIGIFNSLLILLPIYLIIIIIISIIFSIFFFKNIWKMYRYKLTSIIWLNILLYFLLWFLFFYFNISQYIYNYVLNNYIPENIAKVINLENKMEKLWYNPEEWFLFWKIIKYNEKNKNIIIIDKNNKKWIINILKWTLIRNDIILKEWSKIKIEWIMKNDNTFIATKLKPFIIHLYFNN